MAVTAEKSTQVTAEEAGRPTDAPDYHGEMRMFYFSFTQGAAAGDINSTMDLIKLPPGKWRYIAKLSKITCSAFGASRTLDVGHTGWTEPDGDAVAANEIGIHSAADVSAAAVIEPGDELVATDGTLQINSRTVVTIQAKVEGGTIPAAATLKGHLAFMR